MSKLKQHLLAVALAIILTSIAMDAHCLPVSIVIDDPRNMPKGMLAHTTVSVGVCVMTFTPESVKRRDVMLHELAHCVLDADVLGPYGYEGISHEEMRLRELRVREYARGKR